MKIIFSNLGYARGVSGSLYHHVTLARRHIYSSPVVQRQMLQQFREVMNHYQPDICCLVEIDQGSVHTGYFNQIRALMCEDYCSFDIANKYGEGRWIGHMPFHWGKSNGFLARRPIAFNRHYFEHGSKRLIYALQLGEDVTLFFAHFSLKQEIRALQFAQLNRMVDAARGKVIIMGDFNIFRGMDELQPLTQHGLVLLNNPKHPTFTLMKHRLMLDLCLCSPQLAETALLTIIPQQFSDHDALLLEIPDTGLFVA